MLLFFKLGSSAALFFQSLLFKPYQLFLFFDKFCFCSAFGLLLPGWSCGWMKRSWSGSMTMIWMVPSAQGPALKLTGYWNCGICCCWTAF